MYIDPSAAYPDPKILANKNILIIHFQQQKKKFSEKYYVFLRYFDKENVILVAFSLP